MNTAVPANSPTRRDGTTSATLGGSGNKAKQRDGQTVQKQSDVGRCSVDVTFDDVVYTHGEMLLYNLSIFVIYSENISPR